MENKPHCLVLSFPAQGHINPMLQFSKLLQQEGIKVTFVTTLFFGNILQKLPPSITLETISDGFDNGGIREAKGFKSYIDHFWQVGPKNLENLIKKLNRTNHPIDCVIYDAFYPWVLDVAKRVGIFGVSFLTQNMSVNSIYYHVLVGKLGVPLDVQEITLPVLPLLQYKDMPSFLINYEKDPSFLDLAVGQFSNIDQADWILCNSFYELDEEVADWIMKIWPNFRNIGPSIPSMFLDERIKYDEDYGATQFKSEEYCMEWLNDKPKGSVVYVSFGSLASINEEQLEEVACSLKECGNYFLWVVIPSEVNKLPKHFEKKSHKGLVVTWCSQLKVLAHESIGCFVTHCGWNSTLEAISLGVPIVAVPQWSDQATNAKFIVDVWKIGIRAPMDELKIVRRDGMKKCILEIMESEKGKIIKSNIMQLKALAKGAVGVGGSSYKNITEFVNSLFHFANKSKHSQIDY
ncbi:UDP-glycosyltransferase 74G1 [Trifolium repens]|nr:UDP-glycosyltransferase 74G1 [Trifolium repens]